MLNSQNVVDSQTIISLDYSLRLLKSRLETKFLYLNGPEAYEAVLKPPRGNLAQDVDNRSTSLVVLRHTSL